MYKDKTPFQRMSNQAICNQNTSPIFLNLDRLSASLFSFSNPFTRLCDSKDSIESAYAPAIGEGDSVWTLECLDVFWTLFKQRWTVFFLVAWQLSNCHC